MMGKTMKITLVRSLIGRTEKQRRIVKGLGLGKVNSSVIRKDTPEIQGMVRKINFMLHVEEMD
jgi:large subunit ribosomal protein L30